MVAAAFVACGGSDGNAAVPGEDGGGNGEAGATDRKTSADGGGTSDDADEPDATKDSGPKDRDGATVDAKSDAANEAGLDASGDAPANDASVVAMIQDIQDGTIAKGSLVSLAKKFVTGARSSAGGSLNLYVQEPSGQTTTGHTYPEYAGMNVFLSAAEVTTFGASTIAVGDCISVSGTTGEFPTSAQGDIGTTQLNTITAFASATGCGTAPTPLVVTFGDIATDTDLVAANNQPGAKAEIYEGVLVRVESVKTTLVVNAANRFDVSPAAGGSTLEVDNFLYGSAFTYSIAHEFTSITGVYSQLNRGSGSSLVVYRLSPRSAADLVD